MMDFGSLLYRKGLKHCLKSNQQCTQEYFLTGLLLAHIAFALLPFYVPY